MLDLVSICENYALKKKTRYYFLIFDNNEIFYPINDILFDLFI